MRTITRQGKSIIIHTGRQAYIHYHRKARSRGYTTLWTGNGMICMVKTGKQFINHCFR